MEEAAQTVFIKGQMEKLLFWKYLSISLGFWEKKSEFNELPFPGI